MFASRMNARWPDLSLTRVAGAAVVAGAALISVAASGVALKDLGELKSLRADVSAQRTELILAGQRAANLERQLDAMLRNSEQQQATASHQTQGDQVTERRDDRPTFRLTQEETQLVRSYIKASPVNSEATATISLGGNLRNMPLLPLPAQIVGKAPRLGGGKFTVDRNGAIVISLRNSQLADAVIQPH